MLKSLRYLVGLIALTAPIAAGATHIYVNASATGANTGASWANAYTSLQSGISAVTAGDTIWVANGVYKPTTGTSRTVSFVLPSGVAIYGGFTGTETSAAQRDTASFQTVLSGDIGTTGLTTDNSYNIVEANNVSSQTVLDGFKIVYGYASGTSGSTGSGAGFTCSGTSSPTIAHCYFTENHALNGGALYHNGTGSMLIRDCRFSYNSATSWGGALYLSGSATRVINCELSENIAGSGAGALYGYEGVLTFDRCSISGNDVGTATGHYGAAFSLEDLAELHVYNSLIAGNRAADLPVLYAPIANTEDITFTNCTIADNAATDAVQGSTFLIDLNSDSKLTNCIVWGNTNVGLSIYDGVVSHSLIAGGYTAGTFIQSSDPGFVSPGSPALAPFNAAGYDYRLQTLSPAVDTGISSALNALYTLDLADSSRTHGSKPDLGAYENHYCTLSVSISASASQICPGATAMLSVVGTGLTGYLWNTGAATPTLTVGPGSYSVKVTNASGCLGKATKAITASPGSVAISGDSHLCADSTNVLAASGTNVLAYNWTGGATGATISISTAGTYIVSGTTPEGCIVKDTAIVTNAPTPVPVITQSGALLQTGNFATYQWYLNNNPVAGATAQTYTLTANGNYKVEVTSSFGCPGASAVFVLNNLGVDAAALPSLQLYPSPASAGGLITLEDGGNRYSRLTVYNALGQQVAAQEIGAQQAVRFSLPLAGVYLVRCSNERTGAVANEQIMVR